MKSSIPKNQDGICLSNRDDRWRDGAELILNMAKDNIRSTIKILDVGCGDGSFFKFLIDQAITRNIDISHLTYFGLDFNSSYKKIIQDLGGKFINCDVLKISHTTKIHFDVIVASEVIEHIDETDRFIQELKKVLKQDGYIYLTTPNLAAWHCRLMLLFGYQPLPTEVSNISSSFGKGLIGKTTYGTGAIHHIRVFTYKALKEFVQFHGLTIDKVYGGGYRILDKILFRSMFIGLSPIIIMILKKQC